SVNILGNSGPYLQYAHARARSILSRSQYSVLSTQYSVLQPNERSLLRKISEYAEVVTAATRDLVPSHLSTYLYELAASFNRFYEHNRVLDDPRQDVRLSLVNAYADALKKGLEIL